MASFEPNGNVSFEQCPVCFFTDVKVEHGKGKVLGAKGSVHYWHCPDCGDELALVLADCELCDMPKQKAQ